LPLLQRERERQQVVASRRRLPVSAINATAAAAAAAAEEVDGITRVEPISSVSSGSGKGGAVAWKPGVRAVQ